MVPRRRLGRDGPVVSAVGYGAMGLEGYYGAAGEDEAVAALVHALDVGTSLLDTADAYGDGHNEGLVARAIAGRREDAFVATKFGLVFAPGEEWRELPTGWGFSLRVNGRPDYARRALDASLGRLGVETVDLWYLHYVDPETPIEDSVGAMSEAVALGKARWLGLSNVTAAEVRRAAAIHPIAAVQYEYSLWRREVEAELLPTLRELGIALVPWAPLGAGFLAGAVESLGEGDFRTNNPRWTGANLEANRERFAPLLAVAAELGITPAQLALAWLLHQGEDIVPIPGSRKLARIEENAAAASVRLDAATVARISELARPGLATGATLV